MVDAKSRNTRVVMFPWLAHGHIFPFLELAKKLTHRNFHIYICSTPVLVNSIKPKLSHHPNDYSNSIEAVELHLPSTPELPPHYHTTKGLPPHLLPTLMKAFHMSDTRDNFSNIVESVKPDLIIHDFLPSWVPEVASSLSIPTIAFVTSGATVLSFGIHHSKKKDVEYPFPEIYSDSLKKRFMKMVETNSYARNNGKGLQSFDGSCNIVLIKSFRELEGKYIDYLSATFGKKIVPVGPLVPEPVHDDDNEGMDIINWLSKKEKSSTVYVSFGSECYPSKEDMEEIAHGLELSNVNFIWVVRFPEGDKLKLDEALPDGYLGRIRDRGLVVENWAPQIKILDHSSIGGFVSHCGWGSLMESIRFGVPIIAIPMQHDQPWNARLAEVSSVGVEVKRDDSNRLCRENVAKVIKEVVVEKYGEDIRRKTKEMKDNIIRKVDQEIDEAVKEILQVIEM